MKYDENELNEIQSSDQFSLQEQITPYIYKGEDQYMTKSMDDV